MADQGQGKQILIDVLEQMSQAAGVEFKTMRVAGDIMVEPVKTLTLDHRVEDYLKFMKNYNSRHAPVVDMPVDGEKKPFFVGVISDRDVLRLSSPHGEEIIDRKALKQLLGQIVSRNPKSVSVKMPVGNIIHTMISNHIDMVPVLSNNELVGIITTTDLIKLYARLGKAIVHACPNLSTEEHDDISGEFSGQEAFLHSWLIQPVERIMTEPVVCLSWQDSVGRAIEVLMENEFRHLPIIDGEEKLVGIISDRDIIRYLPYRGKRPKDSTGSFGSYLFQADPKVTNLELPLTRIMTLDVIFANRDKKVSEIANVLGKRKIGCMPVLDNDKKVVGIVTITDLIRRVLDVYEPMENF